MSDDMLARIAAAVERGRSGERVAARAALEELWEEIGDDAFHRCVLAHFLADLQDDDHAELHWDELALEAAAAVTDDASSQVRGFLPSLYAGLADDHRRLGDAAQARKFLDRARSAADVLGDDPYGMVVKGAMEKIAAALDEGSTERLS